MQRAIKSSNGVSKQGTPSEKVAKAAEAKKAAAAEKEEAKRVKAAQQSVTDPVALSLSCTTPVVPLWPQPQPLLTLPPAMPSLRSHAAPPAAVAVAPVAALLSGPAVAPPPAEPPALVLPLAPPPTLHPALTPPPMVPEEPLPTYTYTDTGGFSMDGLAAHQQERPHGQQLHGQQLHGQQLHGQQPHGLQVHGQQLHGQQVHGQQPHGQQVHGQHLHCQHQHQHQNAPFGGPYGTGGYARYGNGYGGMGMMCPGTGLGGPCCSWALPGPAPVACSGLGDWSQNGMGMAGSGSAGMQGYMPQMSPNGMMGMGMMGGGWRGGVGPGMMHMGWGGTAPMGWAGSMGMDLMAEGGMTPNRETGRRHATPDTPDNIVAMRAESVGLAAAAGYTGTDEGTRRTIKLKAEADHRLLRQERKRKQEEQDGRNW